MCFVALSEVAVQLHKLELAVKFLFLGESRLREESVRGKFEGCQVGFHAAFYLEALSQGNEVLQRLRAISNALLVQWFHNINIDLTSVEISVNICRPQSLARGSLFF